MLIENIPAITCSSCGETYYHAQTMHDIERIKAHRHALTVTRSIQVAAFSS